MFHQPALEAALERRAGDLGVEIRRGCAVAGLSQHQDVVALATGDGEVVEGRYVVGCDGANSTIRTLLDVPVTELGFFYDWLIVDVVLRHERVFDPINLQVCDPARPTTVVSGGPGRRRWEFMRLDHETLDELESRAWELLEPWDVRPDNATLERRAVYTFAARYAERWRSGRVLLAGDAAHQMPPFAGQGMCAGVRDAANLAWKLDLVLSGSAPDAAARHLRPGATGQRPPSDRVLCRAGQDHLHPRSRRRPRPRRGHGRCRRAGTDRGAAAAGHRRRRDPERLTARRIVVRARHCRWATLRRRPWSRLAARHERARADRARP